MFDLAELARWDVALSALTTGAAMMQAMTTPREKSTPDPVRAEPAPAICPFSHPAAAA